MGSEQRGTRPVLVLQNDIGNARSPTTIVAPLTSRVDRGLPVHVLISGFSCGLACDSVVLCDQVRTIDRSRLGNRVGRLDGQALARVEEALQISLGLPMPLRASG